MYTVKDMVQALGVLTVWGAATLGVCVVFDSALPVMFMSMAGLGVLGIFGR